MICAIVNNKAANAKGIGMPGNTNVRWKGGMQTWRAGWSERAGIPGYENALFILTVSVLPRFS